jgi:hypothetical protein
MSALSETVFIDNTRLWVERVVIGLKLCPFAPAPALKNLIRYIVSEAATPEALLEDLITELQRLIEASPGEIETTLLIHPNALRDFHDYNDFLEIADEALAVLGLERHVQIASFHPDYQFADTEADDVGNATNRSPYPMLHLLREESIARAVESFGDTDVISVANIATLKKLGHDGLAALTRNSPG